MKGLDDNQIEVCPMYVGMNISPRIPLPRR